MNVPQVVKIDSLGLVGNAEEGEHEEDGEHGPDEVPDGDDPGVTEEGKENIVENKIFCLNAVFWKQLLFKKL